MESDPPAEAPLSAPSAAGTPPTTRTQPTSGGAYLDIDDDLPVFCPECAEHEFGTARVRRTSRGPDGLP